MEFTSQNSFQSGMHKMDGKIFFTQLLQFSFVKRLEKAPESG